MNNIERKLSEAIYKIALEINKSHRVEILEAMINDNDKYISSLYKKLNSTSLARRTSILTMIKIKEAINLELFTELSQLTDE